MTNLTAGSSLPKAFLSLAAYAFDAQGTRHVDYEGLGKDFQGDRMIHELYLDASGVHQTLLDDASTLPADPFTSLAGYVFAQSPVTQHVDYRVGVPAGTPGEVVEAWWDGSWHTNRIGWSQGAPNAATGPFAFAFGDQQAVVYQDKDRHPIFLWWSEGTWQHLDLTTVGAPPASNDVIGYAAPPSATETETTPHVIYPAGDPAVGTGPVHHLWRNSHGVWQDDSTSIPTVTASRLAGFVDSSGRHRVFSVGVVGAEPQALVHELARDLAGTWSVEPITPEGGPFPDPFTSLAAWELVDQGTVHVVHQAASGQGTVGEHLLDLWWGSHNGWSIQDLTQSAEAPVPLGAFAGYLSTLQVLARPVTSQYIDFITGDGNRDVAELAWSPLPTIAQQVVDVDGDGKLDVVGFGEEGVWMAQGNGAGDFADPRLVSPGFGYDTSWRVERHPRLLAKITDPAVTGGRGVDVVGFGDAGVWTAVSTPIGTYQEPLYRVADFGYEQGWRVEKHVRLLADLNNDRCADIVAFGDAGVYTAHSQGDGGFAYTPDPLPAVPDFGYDQGWRVDRHPRLTGDLSGGGGASIVGFGDAGVYVAHNDGSGTFTFTPVPVIQNFGYGAGGWRVDKHPRVLADITGTGRDSIVAFGYDGVWTAVTNPDGSFKPEALVLPNFGYNQGWRVGKHLRILADVDGDGAADIVGFGDAGVYVALSNRDGTFRGPVPLLSLPGLGYDQGWRVGEHPRFLADVDNDQKAEIVAFDTVGLRVAHTLSPPSQAGLFASPWLAAPDFGYVPRPW
ncbi:MAG: FG-GAP repeat domain-containing protein [Candidatus Dormibacteraceae bacterium]